MAKVGVLKRLAERELKRFAEACKKLGGRLEVIENAGGVVGLDKLVCILDAEDRGEALEAAEELTRAMIEEYSSEKAFKPAAELHVGDDVYKLEYNPLSKRLRVNASIFWPPSIYLRTDGVLDFTDHEGVEFAARYTVETGAENINVDIEAYGVEPNQAPRAAGYLLAAASGMAGIVTETEKPKERR